MIMIIIIIMMIMIRNDNDNNILHLYSTFYNCSHINALYKIE